MLRVYTGNEPYVPVDLPYKHLAAVSSFLARISLITALDLFGYRRFATHLLPLLTNWNSGCIVCSKDQVLFF